MKDCECKDEQPSAFMQWFYYHATEPLLRPLIPLIEWLTRQLQKLQ